MRAVHAAIFIAAIGGTAAPAVAQRAPRRMETAQDTVREVRGGWSLMRVAKWSTALASAGMAAYGFMENRSADREYEDIERACEADPATCATAVDDGRYANAALEARYQNVLERDDRAKLALLAGQVGLAASVLLFIMDLPEGTTPDDIPYDPRPLRFGMRAGQLEMAIALPVR